MAQSRLARSMAASNCSLNPNLLYTAAKDNERQNTLEPLASFSNKP
jgi:hypothetical protein